MRFGKTLRVLCPMLWWISMSPAEAGPLEILRDRDVFFLVTESCEADEAGHAANCKPFSAAAEARRQCDDLRKAEEELAREARRAGVDAASLPGLDPARRKQLMDRACNARDTPSQLRVSKGYVFETRDGRGTLYPVGREEDIARSRLMHGMELDAPNRAKSGQHIASARVDGNVLTLSSRRFETHRFPQTAAFFKYNPNEIAKRVVGRFETQTFSFDGESCTYTRMAHAETRGFFANGEQKKEDGRGPAIVQKGTCEIKARG
jgi:hypothetical protein